MISPKNLVRSLYERLIFVPVLCVIGGALLGFLSVRLDRRTPDAWLPGFLRSSVSSADSILSTIAGGLISAITLLLSITLVAVQLASSRFSPRTINDWIGDRTQQITIGLVLGTTVFCLMVLRETQDLNETLTISPDLSVLAAVVLMVVCLVMVVRSVGHLSNRMRIGTVARTLMEDTCRAIRETHADAAESLPVAHSRGAGSVGTGRPDRSWTPLTAHRSGWVTNVAWDKLAQMAEEGSEIAMAAPLGAFVLPHEPVAWLERPGDGDPNLDDSVVVIGPGRRIEVDPSFGILQMSDVALRALSPGINDPNTACDVVSYLGVVLMSVWELDLREQEHDHAGRTVVRPMATHEQYMEQALAQIARYGAGDVDVARSTMQTLEALRRETERRDLPGSIEPIEAMRDRLMRLIERADHDAHDLAALRAMSQFG